MSLKKFENFRQVLLKIQAFWDGRLNRFLKRFANDFTVYIFFIFRINLCLNRMLISEIKG